MAGNSGVAGGETRPPSVLPGPARDLTVEMVESWLAELRLSRSSVIKIRSQLALALDHGIRRRVIDWNPARVALLPPTDDTPGEGRALTRTEMRALLNVASDHRLSAWVVTAFGLALRPGEVSGLSWSSVDLDGGVVVVSRSLAWVGKRPVIKHTKTNRTRTLEMPPITTRKRAGRWSDPPDRTEVAPSPPRRHTRRAQPAAGNLQRLLQPGTETP